MQHARADAPQTRCGASREATSSRITRLSSTVRVLSFGLSAHKLTCDREGVRSHQLHMQNTAIRLIWRTLGVTPVTTSGAPALQSRRIGHGQHRVGSARPVEYACRNAGGHKHYEQIRHGARERMMVGSRDRPSSTSAGARAVGSGLFTMAW